MPHTNWKTREATRIATRHYIPVPWMDYVWFKLDPHYAHMSRKQPGLVAYTSSEDKGARDIQTPIKPGKFLEKFFKDALTKAQIAEYANLVRGAAAQVAPPTTKPAPSISVLRILTTTEDCVRAYTHGPSSCMSYPTGGHSGKHHPASIYGGTSELTLAILERDGKITTRVPVWPAKKIAQRSGYGDIQTIHAELTTAGYTIQNAPCFLGAKVSAIAEGTRFVAPTMDGHTTAQRLRDSSGQVIALELISNDEFRKLAPTDRVQFGYYNGLSSP